MQQAVKEKTFLAITLTIYFGFAILWLYINIILGGDEALQSAFSDSYGILALLGSIIGFTLSARWGGLKSLLGKSFFFLSLGMFGQFFGQLTYSIYAYVLQVEAPYPSLGDLGYFGSIPCYIYGILLLGSALGIKINMETIKSKFYVLLIPTALLALTYFMFLSGYSYEDVDLLTVFLDFGYPFGQALYVSLALGIFILSSNVLGGVMKSRIMFLLFALLIQYLADYMFLFESSRGTWVPGGVNDFIYLTSYFIMSLSLLAFSFALSKIK